MRSGWRASPLQSDLPVKYEPPLKAPRLSFSQVGPSALCLMRLRPSNSRRSFVFFYTQGGAAKLFLLFHFLESRILAG
jgi:hypothetical protein